MAWGKGERGGIGRIEWYRQAKAAGGSGAHGPPYRYTTGCRCDPCRDARNAYLREWANRRRANDVAKAKFVVRKGRTGLFRFDLVGPNGKVIATSQAYRSRSSALRGIESVRKHATKAELVDQAGARIVGGRPKTGTPKQVRALPASDVGVDASDEVPDRDVARARVVG